MAVYLVVLFVPWHLVFSRQPITQHSLELSVKISAHVLFLPLSALLRRLLLVQHEQHPCMDYLQFYHNTRTLVDWPFTASSAANALLLVLCQLPGDGPLSSYRGMSRALQATVTLELLSVAVLYAVYMRHLTGLYSRRISINAQLRPIGSLLPEDSVLVLPESIESGPGVPARSVPLVSPELAEVFLYLNQHITWLCRDVVQLEKKLAFRTGSPRGAEPQAQEAQADAHDQLASRDRQLRALMVEQESLQKQQAIAWKMLDEKDAENQRLQVNKRQHMDENARLRSTLREWSLRNVRLEHELSRLAEELERSRGLARPAEGDPPAEPEAPAREPPAADWLGRRGEPSEWAPPHQAPGGEGSTTRRGEGTR
uniref:Transmembrane protein 192 n=1 Tax=Tetraselmis sp. GSL018 TaxID=582737 RepID=A0A061R4V0_9CHLO